MGEAVRVKLGVVDKDGTSVSREDDGLIADFVRFPARFSATRSIGATAGNGSTTALSSARSGDVIFEPKATQSTEFQSNWDDWTVPLGRKGEAVGGILAEKMDEKVNKRNLVVWRVAERLLCRARSSVGRRSVGWLSRELRRRVIESKIGVLFAICRCLSPHLRKCWDDGWNASPSQPTKENGFAVCNAGA